MCDDPVTGAGHGWVYEIAPRRWVRLPDDLFDGCSTPPGGPYDEVGTDCSVTDVGTRWVEFDYEVECYHCGDTEIYYNFRTGAGASEPEEDASYAHRLAPHGLCLLLSGCGAVGLSSSSLDFTALPCAPLPRQPFQPLARGWELLSPITDQFNQPVSVQRCGQRRPLRLAVNSDGVATRGPLVAWAPSTAEAVQQPPNERRHSARPS